MLDSANLFHFNGNPLRVQMQQSGPWFAAQDVCRILGLGEPAGVIATAGLEADEFMMCDVATSNGPQSLMLVSESGLFGLASVSRDSAVKTFLPWLRRDVLPVLDEIAAMRLHEQLIQRRLRCELETLVDDLRDEFMVEVQSIVVMSRPVQSPQTLFMHCYQPKCPACIAEARAKEAGTEGDANAAQSPDASVAVDADADETADDNELSDADVQAFVDAVKE